MLNGKVVFDNRRLLVDGAPRRSRRERSVESSIRDVMSITKRIDVLINNAGHGPGAKPRSPRNWRDES